MRRACSADGSSRISSSAHARLTAVGRDSRSTRSAAPRSSPLAAASAMPYAAATPIAGAPRTTIVRIAPATSAAVPHSTSTSSCGSRRWSRSTTASRSSLRIRSGSSKTHHDPRGKRPAELGPPERREEKRRIQRLAFHNARRKRFEGEPNRERLACARDAGDPDPLAAAPPVAEDAERDATTVIELQHRLRGRGRHSHHDPVCRRARACDDPLELRALSRGLTTREELPAEGMRSGRRGNGDRQHKDERVPARESDQVPSSQEARYFACSSVSVSMSVGTGYTLFSSDAACSIAYSVASAWLAKLMSITRAGCPSAAEMFTRRPSASRYSRRPSARVNSSTKVRASRVSTASSRSAGMSISTLKWPVWQLIAPSFITSRCCFAITCLSPVAVQKI